MTVHFDPAMASEGKYDYLVNVLRNLVRQGELEKLPPERVEEFKTLARAVSVRIEQAAAAHDAPGMPESLLAAELEPALDIDEMLRRLTLSVGS